MIDEAVARARAGAGTLLSVFGDATIKMARVRPRMRGAASSSDAVRVTIDEVSCVSAPSA